MALLSHDPVDAGGSFYLCLTVGVAMLIGQRMLLRGVAVVTLLLLGVGAVCAGLRWTFTWALPASAADAAGPTAWMWLPGLALLIPGLCLLSALIAAYTRRSVEGAEGARPCSTRCLMPCSMGIWARSRSGETVLVNARWMSFGGSGGCGRCAGSLGRGWRQTSCLNRRMARLTTALWSCATGMAKCSLTLFTLRVYVDVLKDFGLLCMLVDETAVRLYEAKILEMNTVCAWPWIMARWATGSRMLPDGVATEINCQGLLGVDPAYARGNEGLWAELIHPDDLKGVLLARQSLLEGALDLRQLDYRIRNLCR